MERRGSKQRQETYIVNRCNTFQLIHCQNTGACALYTLSLILQSYQPISWGRLGASKIDGSCVRIGTVFDRLRVAAR